MLFDYVNLFWNESLQAIIECVPSQSILSSSVALAKNFFFFLLAFDLINCLKCYTYQDYLFYSTQY